MDKSRIEETFPTLLPLTRKVGAGLARGFAGAGRGLWWLFKRVWKPVLVILVLLSIADGVATLVTGRRLDAEIGKLKARGEYVSWGDLAGQPVPDSKNGALVYERAFKLLPDSSKSWEHASAYEDLLNAEKRQNDPTLWLRAQAEVSKYDRALALIDQAQRMPLCRFKANWQDGFAALFPYLQRLRQASRLLCAQALIKAHDGDMDAGLGYVKRAVVASESIKNDPVIIHNLVRAALLNQAAETLRQIAGMGQMPEKSAREFSDYLGRIDLVPGFVNSLRGERVSTISCFDMARRMGAEGFDSFVGGNWRLSLWMRFYCSRLGRPWFYRDELRTLRCWDHVIDLGKREYRTIAKAESEGFDSEVEKCGLLGSILLPVRYRARGVVDRAQSQVNGSRILLALQVYRQQFGSYPETLDKLESSLGWRLKLIDPFSGKQFIYKRQGNGFVFYSVGQNLKDEGGKERPRTVAGPSTKGPPPEPMPRAEEDTDDIVWKMDH